MRVNAGFTIRPSTAFSCCLLSYNITHLAMLLLLLEYVRLAVFSAVTFKWFCDVCSDCMSLQRSLCCPVFAFHIWLFYTAFVRLLLQRLSFILLVLSAAALFHIISCLFSCFSCFHALHACPFTESTGPSTLSGDVLLLLTHNCCSPLCPSENVAAFKDPCVLYHPGCPSTVQYATMPHLAIPFCDQVSCASSMHVVILPPSD